MPADDAVTDSAIGLGFGGQLNGPSSTNALNTLYRWIWTIRNNFSNKSKCKLYVNANSFTVYTNVQLFEDRIVDIVTKSSGVVMTVEIKMECEYKSNLPLG